jgi:hypothetical protein
MLGLHGQGALVSIVSPCLAGCLAASHLCVQALFGQMLQDLWVPEPVLVVFDQQQMVPLFTPVH